MSDQRMQWCRTESMAAAFDCIAKGHDVAEFATGGIVNGSVRMPSSGCVIDPDPSTEQWREAMGRSTSAKLRAAEAERDKASDAVVRLRRLLGEAHDANLRLIQERDEARTEVERLTARIARQPGVYHLTERGMAATEPTQEQPHG